MYIVLKDLRNSKCSQASEAVAKVDTAYLGLVEWFLLWYFEGNWSRYDGTALHQTGRMQWWSVCIAG